MFKKNLNKKISKNGACPERSRENGACPERSRGVAVLFAVLVSVILVSIGATIVSIALRQTILSSTGRDSQVAFYVANTALECARYWDLNFIVDADTDEIQYIFPVSTQTKVSTDNKDLVTCDEFKIMTDTNADGSVAWSQSGNNTSFEILINNSLTNETYCGYVEVEKSLIVTTDSVLNTTEEDISTRIEARGYNVDNCNPTSIRAVERGIEIYYEN